MPQTYANLLVHFIFSTLERRALIHDRFRRRLYGYIAGIINSEFGTLVRINGAADHEHILAALETTTSAADLVRAVKSRSTDWMYETFPREPWYGWQGGYGALSVSESDKAGVIAYIDNQEEHHRTVSFKEELLRLLQEQHIVCDERYLWG